MYKLLCVDMDGTLLNNEGVVSERNLQAIKKAHEKGVKIAICTGRLFTSAKYFADIIGIKAPIISANGAYIREKDFDRDIYRSVLGYENCKKILNILKKYEINYYYNTPTIVFTEDISHPANAYTRLNKTLPKDRQIDVKAVEDWYSVFRQYKDEILKCIAIDEDTEKIQKAKRELLKFEELEVVSSKYNNVEIMCKGVSKGRAVQILAEFYKIKKDEVICIGDNENDLSMIRYAGMGVAMGNAEDYVKEEADFITDTNVNDGVAKTIEKFILFE